MTGGETQPLQDRHQHSHEKNQNIIISYCLSILAFQAHANRYFSEFIGIIH